MESVIFNGVIASNGQRHALEGTRDIASTVPSRRGRVGVKSVEEIPQRIREIAMFRGLGFTFREIGAEFGISPQAVSLMLARHRRAVKSLGINSPLRGLSPRAVNVLGRHSVRTPDEARARNILAILPHERNCGKKTADEIERWIVAESH